MEPRLPRFFPKLSTLLLTVVVGALIGVGFYQLAARGYLPLKNLPQAQNVPSQKTQTIVSEENAVISVVDKASPSVVAIGATEKIFNPFDPFSASQAQNSTIGTGFVVSEKGIIVTNKHVVLDTGTRYNVVTRDGKKFEIRKIYRDPVLDLAIVQIDEGGLSALELGDSSKLKVGQTVVAIGNALGKFTNTVTTGVVSGEGRRVTAGDPFSGSSENLDNLIQTDAAINPGNSGGPLLNSAGQVIGVNVAVSQNGQGIGFALPINLVKDSITNFKTTGEFERPFLGVGYQMVTKQAALLNEVPSGAYVKEVVADSPADKAGIKVGDIITEIEGKKLVDEKNVTLANLVNQKKIWETLSIKLYRDNKEMTIRVQLEKRK